MEEIREFVNRPPQIIFEWQDQETEARGWLVINSLRGGAAGGGTRMHKEVRLEEVIALAKTMEVKFTVAGPPIGGAKSGLRFDPNDPRKTGVLKRWFRDIAPLLRSYYGTSGDLNINEWRDIMPIIEKEGVEHPQQGIVRGHFASRETGRIRRLQQGLSLPVHDGKYAPQAPKPYSVSRMITGYGVSEAIRLFYEIWGGSLREKRVIIQGWGNVGAGTGWHLARQGAKIVGIMDMEGTLVSASGFTEEEITEFFINKTECFATTPYRARTEEAAWALEAEIFVPAASSHLVGQRQLERMKKRGLSLIVNAANAPFKEEDLLYGTTTRYADQHFAIIPDFIASSGMARSFAYLMGNEGAYTPTNIFGDISATIEGALRTIHDRNQRQQQKAIGMCESAYAIAMERLKS